MVTPIGLRGHYFGLNRTSNIRKQQSARTREEMILSCVPSQMWRQTSPCLMHACLCGVSLGVGGFARCLPSFPFWVSDRFGQLLAEESDMSRTGDGWNEAKRVVGLESGSPWMGCQEQATSLHDFVASPSTCCEPAGT